MNGPAAPPRPRRRGTLATRISLLSVGIAVVTALFAGALATGLIRNAGADSARDTLRRLADVSQSVAGERAGPVTLRRLQRALQGLDVRSGVVRRSGRVLTVAPLVRRTLSGDDVTRVLAGDQVSDERSVGGRDGVRRAPAHLGRRHRAGAAARGRHRRQRAGDPPPAASPADRRCGGRRHRPAGGPATGATAAPDGGGGALGGGGQPGRAAAGRGASEVVEVSEAVTAVAGALRHSEERQRQFLLSVSHDLRTPLTAIAGTRSPSPRAWSRPRTPPTSAA